MQWKWKAWLQVPQATAHSSSPPAPAATIFWQPEARPVEFIPELIAWLRVFAAKRGAQYIDYYARLTDENGALQPGYSADGVTPRSAAACRKLRRSATRTNASTPSRAPRSVE